MRFLESEQTRFWISRLRSRCDTANLYASESERGQCIDICPVLIKTSTDPQWIWKPKAEDFPFIGYLERHEIAPLLARLDAAKIEAAIQGEDQYEQEWIRNALGELRAWLETCAKDGRDLVCFYA